MVVRIVIRQSAMNHLLTAPFSIFRKKMEKRIINMMINAQMLK